MHCSRSLPSNSWWQKWLGGRSCQGRQPPKAGAAGPPLQDLPPSHTRPPRSTAGNISSDGCLKTGPPFALPQWHLHRQPADYRNHVRRKMHAYHVFIQAGVVAQGLLQYLAVVAPKLVWASFGSWLRTIRPGIPPSEFVVANALRRTLPDYLLDSPENDSLAKFVADRQDTGSMGIFRLAA